MRFPFDTKNNKDVVRLSHHDGCWHFDWRGYALTADSAVIDVLRFERGVVVGSLIAVHGVPAHIVENFSVQDLRAIGINSVHRMPTHGRRMFLAPSGHIQSA